MLDLKHFTVQNDRWAPKRQTKCTRWVKLASIWLVWRTDRYVDRSAGYWFWKRENEFISFGLEVPKLSQKQHVFAQLGEVVSQISSICRPSVLRQRQGTQCSAGLEQVRMQRDESTTGPRTSRRPLELDRNMLHILILGWLKKKLNIYTFLKFQNNSVILFFI